MASTMAGLGRPWLAVVGSMSGDGFRFYETVEEIFLLLTVLLYKQHVFQKNPFFYMEINKESFYDAELPFFLLKDLYNF